jgi:hypothetical protein
LIYDLERDFVRIFRLKPFASYAFLVWDQRKLPAGHQLLLGIQDRIYFSIRMKELERENGKVKRLVAELSLEMQFLKEVAS